MKAGLLVLPLLAAVLVQFAGGWLLQRPLGPVVRPRPEMAMAYTVVEQIAYVRAIPGLDSPVIGTVPQNAILYATGASLGYWREVSGDGWLGWVLASQLTPDPSMVATSHQARLDH
jgi:hypothetical protein